MRYRVIVGDEWEPCPRLSFAKLRAGERLIADPAPELVIVQANDGRRWRATLTEEYDVELTPLYGDGVPDVPAAVYEARRQTRYVELIDREETRRQRRKSEQQQREEEAKRNRRSHSRPVVCLDNLRPFAAVQDAAAWLGVKQHSTLLLAIKRGRMCGKLRWQYADVILKEVEDASCKMVTDGADPGSRDAVEAQAHSAKNRSLRTAAERALSMRKRRKVQELPSR